MKKNEKYAALVAATAIAVVVIPRYFQTPPPITTDGFVAPGFEDVRRVFTYVNPFLQNLKHVSLSDVLKM